MGLNVPSLNIKLNVKQVSDILDTRSGKSFTGPVTPYFTVDYEYYNLPKPINTFMPPVKKASEKIYGHEVLRSKIITVTYKLGEKRIIKYNGNTYDLSTELDFKRLHNNLALDCALDNI